MTPKIKPADPVQATAFRKAARELGCDGDDRRFQEALRTVAKAKPSEKGGKGNPDRNGQDGDS